MKRPLLFVLRVLLVTELSHSIVCGFVSNGVMFSTSKKDKQENGPKCQNKPENEIMEAAVLKMLDINLNAYSELTNLTYTPPPYIDKIYQVLSSLENSALETTVYDNFFDAMQKSPTIRAVPAVEDSPRHGSIIFNISQTPSDINITGAELVITLTDRYRDNDFYVIGETFDNRQYTWKLETFDENGNGVIDVTNYVLADSKLKKLFFRIETKDELPDINMEPRLLIYENVDFDMFKEKLSRSRRDKRSRIFPTKNIGDLFISRSRFKRRERDKRTADENIVEHRQDTHLETTQIVTESSLTPGTTADSVTLPVHPNVSDTNNSETRSTTSMTSIETTPKRYHCFRHLWEFDFRVIAWNRIIIQPTSFDAGYCKGACTTPFVHRRINSTMYSFLKNLYHKSTEFKDTTVPRAVCTPISYYPQTVQYITETGEFRTKTLLEMRVAACGCR